MVEVSRAALDAQETFQWLDAWKPWLFTTFALIVLSYGPSLAQLIHNANLSSAHGEA